MKKLIFVVIMVASLMGCASMKEEKYYKSMAKEHPFSYYFPASTVARTFSSLEEAYDFIFAARIKLNTASGKRTAKELAARLTGPEIKHKNPAVISYYVTAQSKEGNIDLTNTKDIEPLLRNAIAVNCVILVYYDGRGVSLSDFNLRRGYRFDPNSQHQAFTFGGNQYAADYPVGWGIQKAFQYLRKEIN